MWYFWTEKEHLRRIREDKLRNESQKKGKKRWKEGGLTSKYELICGKNDFRC